MVVIESAFRVIRAILSMDLLIVHVGFGGLAMGSCQWGRVCPLGLSPVRLSGAGRGDFWDRLAGGEGTSGSAVEGVRGFWCGRARGIIGGMISVGAIHVAPVKSLGLLSPSRVHVGLSGILEDRRFYLIDGNGRLVTQRELGWLVRVKAEYQAEPEELRLELPSGQAVEGELEEGEPVSTRMWGRSVRGHVLTGDWGPALSSATGVSLNLVRADQPGQCYDEFPVSVLSQGSLLQLGTVAGNADAFDGRRFRPNFLLEGCEPHEEDGWLGHAIQIGERLRLRLISPDPRCAITTQDPDTGERNVDTLRLIMSYRPNPIAAYFGVYAIVERPGEAAVGDRVELLG